MAQFMVSLYRKHNPVAVARTVVTAETPAEARAKVKAAAKAQGIAHNSARTERLEGPNPY